MVGVRSGREDCVHTVTYAVMNAAKWSITSALGPIMKLFFFSPTSRHLPRVGCQQRNN